MLSRYVHYVINKILVLPRAWNASLSNMTIPVGENLELALKCWKTFNQENQPECQNDFSILRYNIKSFKIPYPVSPHVTPFKKEMFRKKRSNLLSTIIFSLISES